MNSSKKIVVGDGESAETQKRIPASGSIARNPPPLGNLDWESVRRDIVKVIEVEDLRRADGTGLAPTLLRLAWHASGTYDARDGTGGSNGATMRFQAEASAGANQGLMIARRMLGPIKSRYSALTYADLWTFAGKVAVENMGGPIIPWRPGRVDYVDGKLTPPDGRLPETGIGATQIRELFGRMGFNDQEIVALCGAHSVGRCYVDNSGHVGPWNFFETEFSNRFFTNLVQDKYTPKTEHKGCKWTGPMQYANAINERMMLPTDMALLNDRGFNKWVTLYAKDQDKFFEDFAAAFGKLMALGVPGQDGNPEGSSPGTNATADRNNRDQSKGDGKKNANGAWWSRWF